MSESMTYIAKRPCGCIVAASVDNPERRADVAEFVSDCIREGYTVERVTTEDCRNGQWACHCDELPL